MAVASMTSFECVIYGYFNITEYCSKREFYCLYSYFSKSMIVLATTAVKFNRPYLGSAARSGHQLSTILLKKVRATTCTCSRLKKNVYKIILTYLPPSVHDNLQIYKILQEVNIKTLKSSNRSNKLMFPYLLITD